VGYRSLQKKLLSGQNQPKIKLNVKVLATSNEKLNCHIGKSLGKGDETQRIAFIQSD